MKKVIRMINVIIFYKICNILVFKYPRIIIQ